MNKKRRGNVQQPGPGKYASPNKIAENYPFSPWQVRQLARQGKISFVKLGGAKSRLLIPIAEIERLIREGTRSRMVDSARPQEGFNAN